MRKFSNRTRILVLIGFMLFCGAFYVLWGLTAKNFDFNFPLRMKKVAAVLVVSYAVGHSTLLFQTITNNHILTPSIMGLDRLYMFLQTAVVFFFGSKTLTVMTDIPSFLLSLLLMIGASLLLFLFLFRGEEQNVYFLVLVGMVFGTLFGGLSSFMQVLIDPNEFSILEGRMFASFNKINVDLLWISIGIVFVVFLVSLKDLPLLDVLALGRTTAISLGVSYNGIVMRSFVYVSILTSVATVLVGPVSFLGILVISLARNMTPTFHHGTLLATTVFLGAGILLFGMIITERLLFFSVPISVVVNFVGGIYFIFLLLKESRS